MQNISNQKTEAYPQGNEIVRRVADLDESDKPREKALSQGIDALTDSELMAIILGSGMPGKSVIDLSREILRDCGGRLSFVARTTIHSLVKKYDGIGPAKAVSLAAAFELGARCQRDMVISQKQITDSRSAYELMRADIELLNHEEFWVIHLNRANRVTYRERISKGGTAATVVDVKVLMKGAVDKLSSSLIVVHNHPSGNLNPSREDDDLTRRIKEAAKILDMRLVDHLIISSGGYYSYADQGRL